MAYFKGAIRCHFVEPDASLKPIKINATRTATIQNNEDSHIGHLGIENAIVRRVDGFGQASFSSPMARESEGQSVILDIRTWFPGSAPLVHNRAMKEISHVLGEFD